MPGPSTHFCKALFVLFALSTWGLAQSLPCGSFEWDGLPGYGERDLVYSASFWLDSGSFPEVPDRNDDGRVDIRDLVTEGSCERNLNHGLLGRYYGFDTGVEDEITFPDFENLPTSHGPVVVRATESLEELESFAGFMDSNMRSQFGAVYTGFLFVPETAAYNLHIFGDRGMRLFLDGEPLLAFDTEPREDSAEVTLTYGLHPIRIEYYAALTPARILFDWSSDGEIIGPGARTVGLDYLYHTGETFAETVDSEVEIHFNPPSGHSLTKSRMNLEAYVTGPGHGYSLMIDDESKIMREGYLQTELVLNRGVNRIPIVIEDQAGVRRTFDYYVYVALEDRSNPGTAATLYANEWAEYPLPDIEPLIPFAVTSHTGTATPDNNGSTVIGGHWVNRYALVEFEGVLEVPDTDTFHFEIDGPGAVFINGVQVCGVNFDYRGQSNYEGRIFLNRGANHYRAITGNPFVSPRLQVSWAQVGGQILPLEEDSLTHGVSHGYQGQLPQSTGSGGRVSDGLVGEYLFSPGRPWNDSSGFGAHLLPDPRALVRETGGVTYQSAGSLSSDLAGIFLANLGKRNHELSIEVDFIPDATFQDGQARDLASLSTVRARYLARLYIIGNDLYFRIYSANGAFEEVTVPGVVTAGRRMHVVGVFTDDVFWVTVNGTIAAQKDFQPATDLWPSSTRFNVGQSYQKRVSPAVSEHQMIGSFLVAAAYTKALTEAEIRANLQANVNLTPSPPDLPTPDVTPFPAAGVTDAQMDEAHHILNRLSFGPSIESLSEVLDVGADDWIARQMDPDSINDQELDDLLAAGYFWPQHDEADLQAQTLFRMILSKRQLLEVMTWFWENHFNTELTKVNQLDAELEENERFRAHALGNFADLLRLSATNYPMVVYLDNGSNVVGAPNENYAREFFELHTMGVNNGYTHADILEAARVFTGWSVREDEAFFNPGLHDFSPKRMVGLEIPAGGGRSDAMLLIQHMVTLRETADFITWKLCQLFVADNPPLEVQMAASDAFFNSQGDIKQTLSAIFGHAQFRSQTDYRTNKIRSPLELVTTVARMGDAYPTARNMNNYLFDMGMRLFDFPDPTGFPEEGVAWIDTNAHLTRWNLVDDFTSNRGNGNTFGMNFSRFIEQRGLSTADDVLDFFSHLTVHGSQPDAARATMMSWLTGDSPETFELNQQTIDNQVRQTFGLFLRLPEMNQQ